MKAGSSVARLLLVAEPDVVALGLVLLLVLAVVGGGGVDGGGGPGGRVDRQSRLVKALNSTCMAMYGLNIKG